MPRQSRRRTTGGARARRKRPRAFRHGLAQQSAVRRRWRKRLPSLTEELANLMRSSEIFWELQEVAKKNPAVGTPGAFFTWLRINYVETLSIGVRRFVDSSDDVHSLWRLLYEVLEHPGVINRRAHRAMYGASGSSRADSTFDNLAGSGRSVLSQRAVRSDLRAVEDAHTRIRRFVNKRVAHRTSPGMIRRLPTYGDLDSALRIFDRILCKYNTLLTASGLSTAYATPQYDWRDVLRVAWMPADDQHE